MHNICELNVPSHVYYGSGSISMLGEIFGREAVKCAVLFTDSGVYGNGLCKPVEDIARDKGVRLEIIQNLKSEPTVQDVENTLEQLNEISVQLVIAMGGGSVMDAAKLCACLYDQPYTVNDALDDAGVLRSGVPTVMIPTTCGTGSEATCNAIVAVPERQIKIGIVNNCMIPDYVILDPCTIKKLPAKIIAATGVDALAHCVECYTSKKSTVFSDIYAMEGAKLIFGNLVNAYAHPGDMAAKGNMMLAAFYGGIAITASGTTAVHALAYPLGGKYHIAHGVSNAILFAPVMKFNRLACEERLAAMEDALCPAGIERGTDEKSYALIERIEKIVQEVQIPTDLSGYGITMADMDFLVEGAADCKRLLNNNMAELTREDIRNIYLEVVK